MANDVYTENLGDFRLMEFDEAIELLEAAKKGWPSDFYTEGVRLAFNRNSGNVFFTNDDYQVCMGSDELYSYYITPYDGYEGFLEELIDWYNENPDDWHEEDVEYLRDLCSDDDILKDNHIDPDSLGKLFAEIDEVG